MNTIMDAVSDFVADQHIEAEAERIDRYTPISYWCRLFYDCVYSPSEFYQLIAQGLQRRQIPDLLVDFVLMHEGTIFSKRRLYYQMRRERIVAEICAAPFGSGFFVSARLFDRRRRAFYWDYLIAFTILMALTVPVWREHGSTVALVVFGTVFTLLWSLMRLATDESFAALDERICKVPWFGPIYETIFHPRTYFREDQHNMYREAVNRSVTEAVAELTTQKGLRPLTDAELRPILPELR